MSQHDMIIDNASGAAARADINSALPALASTSKGPTRPSTVYAGQMWIDDNTPSSSIWTLNLYDGTNDIPVCLIDITNDVIVRAIGGSATTLASASTVDLGSALQPSITISGTTTITAFGSSASIGQFKFVKFSGTLTLTHNGTSLIVPGGANITTATGDFLIAEYAGSGNWVVQLYARRDGTPVVTVPVAKGGTGAITAAAARAALGCDFPVMLSSGTGTIADGQTRYFGPTSVSATETDVQYIAPRAGVVKNLRTYRATGNAGTAAYTLRKNAADTALTCSSTGAQTASDTSNTVSVAAGDLLTVKVVTSGGANTEIHRVSFGFE